jgi:hypothetical protein
VLKRFFEKIQTQFVENPHSTRIQKKHKLLNCGISTATLRGDLDSFQLFVSNIPLLEKCFQWEPRLTRLFNHTVRLKREKKVEIFLKGYKEYSYLFPDSNIGTLFEKELSVIV